MAKYRATSAVKSGLAAISSLGDTMHDVFVVTSKGADGTHITRTIYAGDEDDARQAHRDNYADEPIVAVHQ